jgi:hypothetical protein
MKSFNDISMVSTMIASAVAATKQQQQQQQNNTNMIENQMKYNAAIYNQQLYTESLAKLISYFKPAELIQRYNNNNNSNPLMYQSNQNNARYHPYSKPNNILNSTTNQLDLLYSQQNQPFQNLNVPNSININNSMRMSESPSSQLSSASSVLKSPRQ